MQKLALGRVDLVHALQAKDLVDGLGGAAIEALHAQAKSPVYMIAINEVSDQEGDRKSVV